MIKTNRRRLRVWAVPGGCLLAATWLSAAAAPVAMAQVLEQVPSDALVVLKVNHLSDTDVRVAALLQQVGVTDLVPQAKAPLKSLEDQAGIGPGIDEKRDAAVYMPNGPFLGPHEAPPVVVLVPVSDYDAFVKSTTLVRTEGDVSVVHFKDTSDDAFVQKKGTYAAVSDHKENLDAKAVGLKATGAAARELDQKDFCLYVNFPTLKGVLLPKLGEARTKAQAEAERNMANADPAKKQLGHAVIDQGFNVVERFLDDAQGTTIGLSVGKAGISSNMIVAFQPDAYLGQLFGGMKTTEGPLLGGLPDEKYLFFGGSVQDPQKLGKLIDDLVAPITAKLDALGDNGKKIQSVVEAYRSALVTSEGGSIGYVVPTAAFGQGSLLRYVAIFKADAEKLKAAQERLSQVQGDVMASLGVNGGGMMKSTVTPNAKTVDGVAFDKIDSEIDPAANNGQGAQAQQMVNQVFGPDGISVLIGAANAHTLVTTLGVDDQLLGAVVEAAKSDKDVLTAQVKAVDAELPKMRAAAAYLDLAQMFTTTLSYMRAMGMNMPVQLPPNLPPVGFAAGTEDSGLRFDAFVPTSLMQSMVQAGLQIYLQTPHGNGGGL